MVDQANSIFVDQSESVVATIGSNYLQNFLSGGTVEKGVGVLTQKRCYYKGKNFSGTGKDMAHTTEEGVVSIEDITFTKFTHTRNIGALVLAILCAVVASICVFIGFTSGGSMALYGLIASGALSVFCFNGYFTSRNSLFVISFPGGSFGFNIRYYPIADIRDFQRQVHLMKDHIKENA